MEAVLLQHEVEQFYYEEAALLDERRMQDWLALLAPDVHYWMPIRRTVMLDEIENEFTKPGAMAYFDDDKTMLEARVKKLGTGYSWSEDPPSRTRHHITNVRVIAREGDELTVESNFHLYRTRLESDEDFWMGRRRDVLRRIDGGLRIAVRHIFLDHTVLQSRNMSNFF
ncbi:MAG: aromatic-ring-hydroxylating dioxygenase subunit beta [Myxococcota bacterium]|nr:aromatic-ring-hydroxylating dioxygenase subunit beta [Myxococcota bacterium]